MRSANRVARTASRPPVPDRTADPMAAEPPQADGSDLNAERAERRARGKVRRFAVDNATTRLLTITRADQTHDPRVMLDALAEFQRRLRERYPRLVWVRALERHKSGAIHAHYAISHRLDHATVARLWGHGFVWLSPKTRTKRGGREDARVTARYVAKYVGKAAARQGAGAHRYEVRQGFQPATLEFWADDLEDARAIGSAVMGYGDPTYAWTSSGQADWTGPPAAFLSW
jgi:hypothetical protein